MKQNRTVQAALTRYMKSRRKAGPCVHCVKRKGTRPRGLCGTCYYDPTIRVLYPLKGMAALWGSSGSKIRREQHKEPPLAALGTEAMPGTEGKVEEMARRAERGEQVFHPKDAESEEGEADAMEMAMFLRLFKSMGGREPASTTSLRRR